MQTISEAYANTILSNDFTYDKAPIFYLVIEDGGEYQITKASSFKMSREFGAIAQSCVITIPNVNYNDPSDTGYYNQVRDMTAHNKPANSYYGLIQPGKDIYIKAGYGSDEIADTVRIITANIDTVKVTISGNGDSILEIQARCSGKKLVDGIINQTDPPTKMFWIRYPIISGMDTVYLTAADTNPYLYQVWRDVCQRAGFDSSDVHYDTSWTLRVGDLDRDTFREVTGSWADLADKICKLLGAYMYEDEYGGIYLKEANTMGYYDTDNLVLNDYTWVSLTGMGNYRAIEDTIVVTGYDRTDWDFDYAGNKIRRAVGTHIPNHSTVTIGYSYCAWCYKPNQIYSITQLVSHDECYGTLEARNEELYVSSQLLIGAYGDGSIINVDKALIENHPEFTTNGQCAAYVAAKKLEIKKNYFNVSGTVVAIPHLRLRDTVCFLLYGTITGIYEITGFSFNYSANSGFTQSIEGVFYQNSGVY